MSLCTLCGVNAIDPASAPYNLCGQCFQRMTMKVAPPPAYQPAYGAQQPFHSAPRQFRGTPRGRMLADMICTRCGNPLDPGAPDWVKLCKRCYREDREGENQAVLRRALEAENKVELAKKVVIELQSKLRAAEGQLRRMNGQVGVQKGPPVAGAMGLDKATLQRMRRLCHPDKHGNSQAANEVTLLLNQLIDAS